MKTTWLKPISVALALVLSTAAFATTYQYRQAVPGLTTNAPPAQPVTTTQVLNFDTWPTYDATFFTVTGTATAAPSWLGASYGNALVTPAAISNGNFFITFVVPAGATNASLSFNSKTDYPNDVRFEKKVGGTWTFNATIANSGASTYPLSPGTYRIYSETGNGFAACTFAWCMNGKSYIDDVVVTYTP